VILNRILLGFAILWAGGVAVLTLIDLWRLVAHSPSVWHVLDAMLNVGGPAELKYLFERVLMLIPAMIAFGWLEARKESVSKRDRD